MPGVALGLYVAFAVVAFGWRTWIQYRRTGDHGFRGTSGKAGSLEWWGGVLLTSGMVLGAGGPAAELAGLVTPLAWPHRKMLGAAGLTCALAGFAVTVLAQVHMRASWRIGVDERETTGLVTTGIFAAVRNPIFSGMVLVLIGVLLMAPNPLCVAALAATVVGLEIQVRRVEEPYLLRRHGTAYDSYARKTGRFVPGIGMLRG